MRYRVVTLPAAELDVSLTAAWIAQRDAAQAQRWVVGINEAIESLAEFPRRCRIVRSTEFAGEPVRQLLHGRRNRRYRILFRIRGDRVEVLSVRHAARRAHSR